MTDCPLYFNLDYSEPKDTVYLYIWCENKCHNHYNRMEEYDVLGRWSLEELEKLIADSKKEHSK